MTFRPSVTVAAIVERAGRFLLVEERAAGRAVLNQPAGHLEPGESLLEAVIRETLEETGCHFRPRALVGLYLWHGAEGRPAFLRVAFAGELHGREAGRGLDPDIIACHWLGREQLAAEPARLRSPLVLRCMDDYLAGARYPLSLLSTLAADAAP